MTTFVAFVPRAQGQRIKIGLLLTQGHPARVSVSRARDKCDKSREGAMNRHQRRRQAAMARQNRFVQDYVEHLPEVGPEALAKPGVTHLVYYHDDRCAIFDGNACSCDPHVRLFAEPKRS